MYVAEEAGGLHDGNLHLELKAGEIVLVLKVENWEWCGCDGQEGAYLGVNLTLTEDDGRGGEREVEDLGMAAPAPKAFDLHYGALMDMNRQVRSGVSQRGLVWTLTIINDHGDTV